MQEKWINCTIENIASEIAMGPFGSNIKRDNFVNTGVPVIRGGNLNEGRFKDYDFVYLTEEKATSLKRSIAYPNELVFTHRGTIGQVGIIPENSYSRYIVSQSQMRLAVDEKKANPLFVFYFFRSKYGQLEWLKNSSQVGVPAIAQPTASLKGCEINLPPLQEQKAIASILSVLDDKIELNLQMNKTLEEMAMALYKHWFVDFGPFQDGKFVESELGMIPEGWGTKTLGEATILSAGGDKPKNYSKNITAENKIPIYSNGISHQGLYGYTDLPKINDESVTISARGTIGFVCLRLHSYFPIVRLISAIPDQMLISGKYLYLYLKNQDIFGTGTTQQQLTVPDFSRSQIIIPNTQVVKDFTKIVDSFYTLIESNTLENQTLTTLRDTLLPKLISGEVRVKDIEHMVAASL